MPTTIKQTESIEEQLRKSRERIMRLKDLSMKLRNGNIQEMENVPAYKRKEDSITANTVSRTRVRSQILFTI
jgi:cell division protein FtsZ